MKDKSEIDSLIVSFLLKELNAEDEAYVLDSIRKDEKLRQDFGEFEKLWSVLRIKQNIDGIDIEQERNRFEQILKEKRQLTIDSNVKSEHGIYDLDEAEVNKSRNTHRLIRKIAVAASVIFLVGVGWLFVHFNTTNKPDTAADNETLTETQKFFAHIEKNTTGKSKIILLDDGSEVILWDKSEISFLKPFAGNKRDISLTGKALFKVAKDEKNPFSVYSGDIVTTALGTDFLVTNFERELIIAIQLFEGKVVVSSVDSIERKLAKSFYLLPGQEFVYNKRNATAKVRKFQNEKPETGGSVKMNSPVKDNPSIPENNDGSWYMFNNQSLPDIFDQLESMFGVSIVYERKDVEKLYFIGKFNKQDSLEYILQNIAKINKLKLLKEQNKFIITRQD